MTDFYPRGAIQTEAQLEATLGQITYHVYGFASTTEPLELILADAKPRRVNLGYGDSPRYVPFYMFHHFTKHGNYTCENSAGDMNIPRNTYNEHYLFTERDDALAYIAWLNANGKPSNKPSFRYTW